MAVVVVQGHRASRVPRDPAGQTPPLCGGPRAPRTCRGGLEGGGVRLRLRQAPFRRKDWAPCPHALSRLRRPEASAALGFLQAGSPPARAAGLRPRARPGAPPPGPGTGLGPAPPQPPRPPSAATPAVVSTAGPASACPSARLLLVRVCHFPPCLSVYHFYAGPHDLTTELLRGSTYLLFLPSQIPRASRCQPVSSNAAFLSLSQPGVMPRAQA